MFVELAPRCVRCAQALHRVRRRELRLLRGTLGVAAVVFTLGCALLPGWSSDARAWGARAHEVRRAMSDLEGDSCDAGLVEALADLLSDAGDAATAVRYVDSFRVRCGTDDRILYTAARLHRRNHEWRDEVIALRRLIPHDPDNALLLEWLGEAHEALREKLLAADAYTTVLRTFGNVHGRQAHALNRLMALYIDVGLLDLATQTRQWAAQNDPHDVWHLPDPYAVWPEPAS